MLRQLVVGWIVLGLAAPPSNAGEATSPEPSPPVQRPRQIEPAPTPDPEPATPTAPAPMSAEPAAPATVPAPPGAAPATSPATAPALAPAPPPVQRLTPPPPETVDVVVAEPETSAPPLPEYDDAPFVTYDAREQAERAAMTRRLVGARTLMAIGGVSLATGLMMVVGAGIEAAKKECEFEEACEDPPRRDIVRGLAAGGGVLTALGAVAVGFSVPMAKRARLELDASRRQASVGVHVRF